MTTTEDVLHDATGIYPLRNEFKYATIHMNVTGKKTSTIEMLKMKLVDWSFASLRTYDIVNTYTFE